MTSAHYQLDWPRENLIVRCFVHDVMNYRYHWHEDDYELSILLHGTQEYCRGNKNFLLRENDIILTAPGIGHASMGQQADTIAFVLHFSASAFKPFLKKAASMIFPPVSPTRRPGRVPITARSGSTPARSSGLPRRAEPMPSWPSVPTWTSSSLPSVPGSPPPCSTPCRRINPAGMPSAVCWRMSQTIMPKS